MVPLPEQRLWERQQARRKVLRYAGLRCLRGFTWKCLGFDYIGLVLSNEVGAGSECGITAVTQAVAQSLALAEGSLGSEMMAVRKAPPQEMPTWTCEPESLWARGQCPNKGLANKSLKGQMRSTLGWGHLTSHSEEEVKDKKRTKGRFGEEEEGKL